MRTLNRAARWRRPKAAIAAMTALALVLAACGNGDDDAADEVEETAPADDADDEAEAPDDGDADDADDADDAADEADDEPLQAPDELAADFGVDIEEQVVRVGVLDDLTGPAAGVGVPFALGKEILAEQLNAGEIDLIPAGWTVELIQRDHGYNPQESVQAFNEIVDDVLFVGTVMGTPTTLPLVPIATPQGVAVFPASLSSELAVNEYTPPIGAPYLAEAHQAVDHALEEAGDDLSIAIVYQLDDYGQDGLDGIRQAAEFHGIEIATEQGVAPGEADVTAVVTALQDAEATHVLVTVLPTTLGPLLGTAAQLGYTPAWYGMTPAWIDRFFDPEVIPPAVYANFRWVTGLPLWGEDLPGMPAFLDAYERYGADSYPPDFYILTSYIQGLLQFEAFSRAVQAGDVTREGYYDALRSISDFDGFGLFPQPLNLVTFPFETQTDTRILTPGESNTEWTVLRDFSTPDSYQAVG